MNILVPSIEISNMPDLLHVVKAVQASKKPRMLKVRGETLAMVMPVSTAAKPKKKEDKRQKNFEAFLAAGSWKDIDVEKFKKDMYESRSISTSPPIQV